MSQIRPGEELSAAVTAPARLVAVLLSSFAVLALLLIVTGLYSVLSYMVARRRREIGVRAALGAGRGDVIAIVWRRTMTLALTGLIVGSAGAFGVGRLLNSLLGGMPADLSIAVAVSWCAIAMASAMAALVPAAQAASVDPIDALRNE